MKINNPITVGDKIFTQANIVIVECKIGESTFSIKPKIDRLKVRSTDVVPKYYKQIVASDSERIESGDHWINLRTGDIDVAGKDGYNGGIQPVDYKKIILFQEEISPKIVEDILNYKLKNYDKVMVECTKDYTRCGGHLELLGGDGEDGEGMQDPFWMKCEKCGRDDLNYNEKSARKGCASIIDINDTFIAIKFDHNGHAIIKKAETRKWTIKQVDDYHIHLAKMFPNYDIPTIDEWFDQNK